MGFEPNYSGKVVQRLTCMEELPRLRNLCTSLVVATWVRIPSVVFFFLQPEADAVCGRCSRCQLVDLHPSRPSHDDLLQQMLIFFKLVRVLYYSIHGEFLNFWKKYFYRCTVLFKLINFLRDCATSIFYEHFANCLISPMTLLSLFLSHLLRGIWSAQLVKDLGRATVKGGMEVQWPRGPWILGGLSKSACEAWRAFFWRSPDFDRTTLEFRRRLFFRRSYDFNRKTR